MRKWVILLVMTAGLIMPSVANAGCTAIAGASAFDPTRGAMATHHGIDCTTLTSPNHYKVDEYLQADNGGWHTTTPVIIGADLFNIPSNFHQLYVAYWQCNTTYIPLAANNVRSETIVVNWNTGSTSTAFGPPTAIPSGCP